MRSSSDTAIVSRRQTRDKTINNGNEAVVRCRGVRIRFLWTRSRTNLKTNVHVQRAESSCCFTNINRTGIPRNVLFRQKTGGDMLSICLFVYLSGNGGWRRQQPAGRLATHVCGSAAAWCYIFIRWTGWTFAVILSRQALLASFAALFSCYRYVGQHAIRIEHFHYDAPASVSLRHYISTVLCCVLVLARKYLRRYLQGYITQFTRCS